MVILTGKNLGERQKDLNLKVTEAVTNKIKLVDIKTETEGTDIAILYKIDIASQYKDIDYIIAILKCGDGLYISRALKCPWLYEDNYSHIINAENLNATIFPYMSIRMKRKMLLAISLHLNNENRAASFYLYCNKNKMFDIGFKFLNITSKEFKLEELRKEGSCIFLTYFHKEKLIKNFVGNNFDLAISVINIDKCNTSQTLHNLRYLYSVSNEKYLEIMEKYEDVDVWSHNKFQRLGLRISKDIMVRYKKRVFQKPLLYINKLNQSMLVKYSTIKDAKKYITSLMPKSEGVFWEINFCTTYNYIIDIVPMSEKWQFIKDLFSTHYPGNPFEMKSEFYHLEYYKMLPVDEREKWALQHIKEKKEFFGKGNDYIWYKFVNLDTALTQIRNYITVLSISELACSNIDAKRSDMLNILVESSRDQKDLKKLLNYYYDRHLNEIEYYKKAFVMKVLNIHNVYEFDQECWDILYKLFLSFGISADGNFKRNTLKNTFTAIAVLWHILQKQAMHQELIDFVEHVQNYVHLRSCFDKLNKEQSEVIFQYLLKLYVDKLQPFNLDPHNKEVRGTLKQYVNNISNLFSDFCKDAKDLPKIVVRFLHIDYCKDHEIQKKKITLEDLYRFLKTDATLAVNALSHFEQNINDLPQRLNLVLRKIKTYFPGDVSQKYINFFDRWLTKLSGKYDGNVLVKCAVFGLFQLADENYKITLLEKYCPSDPKIDNNVVDKQFLFLQESICKLVGYSRPPVPLENILKYVKGDYTKYCLPLFNMYVVDLPVPLVIKFIVAAQDAPSFLQEQALRAAFKCFIIDDLKNLVVRSWRETKHVSFRMIIYKLVFLKVIDEKDITYAHTFYDLLKIMTLEVHEDDHDDLFELITSDRMPDKFMGDYLRTAWDMAIRLPEKPSNAKRQLYILKEIEKHIDIVDSDFICKRIIEEHVDNMLEKKKLHPHEMYDINELYKAKWDATAKFISLYETNEELEERLELLTDISKRCINMWNEKHEGRFLYREFYFEFVNRYKKYWSHKVPILQHIHDTLLKLLSLRQVYLIVWDIELTIFYSVMFSCNSFERFCREFANEVGTMLKKRLEKNQLYSVLFRDMAESIKDKVCDFEHGYINYDEVENRDLTIMFCECLVDLGIKEGYVLALMVLPVDVNEQHEENHRQLLQKIQSVDDGELQSLLSYKFGLKI